MSAVVWLSASGELRWSCDGCGHECAAADSECARCESAPTVLIVRCCDALRNVLSVPPTAEQLVRARALLARLVAADAAKNGHELDDDADELTAPRREESARDAKARMDCPHCDFGASSAKEMEEHFSIRHY